MVSGADVLRNSVNVSQLTAQRLVLFPCGEAEKLLRIIFIKGRVNIIRKKEDDLMHHRRVSQHVPLKILHDGSIFQGRISHCEFLAQLTVKDCISCGVKCRDRTADSKILLDPLSQLGNGFVCK